MRDDWKPGDQLIYCSGKVYTLNGEKWGSPTHVEQVKLNTVYKLIEYDPYDDTVWVHSVNPKRISGADKTMWYPAQCFRKYNRFIEEVKRANEL